MRIYDFKLYKHRRELRKWVRRTAQSILLDLDYGTVAIAQRCERIHRLEVHRLKLRSTLISHASFNLNSISEQEALENYRFRKRDVVRISEMMAWNGKTERNEYRCHPLTSACFVLHKLGTCARWADLEEKYGKFRSQMSEIMWEVVELFVPRYEYALRMRGDFLKRRAKDYARAIHDGGAPLERCVGFIDCTKIRMCRPGGHNSYQRAVYSGHKRVHCLIYQTITTPDGLMFALYGPVEGRRHDLTLLRESRWSEVWQECLFIDGDWYYLYGDSAYLLRPWMQRPYTRGVCSAQETAFNTQMSEVRVSVEHNYKDLKQLWNSQDFARKIKVRQSPVALLYKMSALLTNFRVCLYQGGQINAFFDCPPPTLEEYLDEGQEEMDDN